MRAKWHASTINGSTKHAATLYAMWNVRLRDKQIWKFLRQWISLVTNATKRSTQHVVPIWKVLPPFNSFESDRKGITEPSAPRLAAILPNLNSRTLAKSRIQTRIVSISSLITASSKVGSSLARVDEDKFDDEITEEEKGEKRIVEEDRSCREGEGRHVQLIQF